MTIKTYRFIFLDSNQNQYKDCYVKAENKLAAIRDYELENWDHPYVSCSLTYQRDDSPRYAFYKEVRDPKPLTDRKVYWSNRIGWDKDSMDFTTQEIIEIRKDNFFKSHLRDRKIVRVK